MSIRYFTPHSGMESIMIEISHLVKRYGAKFAVDDISFSVGKGEIVGFLGPNGAGKSTTMNILTGYLSSTQGNVEINGLNVLDNPLEAKKLIGYLPEQPPLYPDMTVEEYLKFTYDLKGCTLNREKHLDEICEVVKIKDVYKRIIGHLSKGYRQRVGIAQALVGNPEVIIFDEPTVGLDPKQIIEIRNLIRTLGKNNYFGIPDQRLSYAYPLTITFGKMTDDAFVYVFYFYDLAYFIKVFFTIERATLKVVCEF